MHTMTDRNENGKPVVNAGTPKAKDDTEGLKKRIQRHYDITSDQFLKVWYGAANPLMVPSQFLFASRWLTKDPPI